MSNDNLFVYVGVYGSPDDADMDYEALRQLHSDGVVGSYDVAIVAKDDSGKVHVRKHEKPTQHGAWSGLAIGALVGAVFPPSIIATGAVGAVGGGLIGHFARGISRGDMKDLGEMLDEGEATLVVVGKDKLDEQLEKAMKRANKAYEKEITADAHEFRSELDRAIDETVDSASV